MLRVTAVVFKRGKAIAHYYDTTTRKPHRSKSIELTREQGYLIARTRNLGLVYESIARDGETTNP
jgi:hypothetical protein